CLGVGALAGLPGLAPIAVGYGLLQYASVLTYARLQETVTSGARATVLSVAGFGLDTGALVVYAAFGAGSLWLDTARLSALFGVPIVAIAVVAARWVPAREIPSPRGGEHSRVSA
ncbi:MAG: MFS transporter, partial [Hamadaea sp.]|nr:MFS transporter [Hamadaea sp.]